jgi:uncharacterized membrane protein YhaH (DUF805 family)
MVRVVVGLLAVLVLLITMPVVAVRAGANTLVVVGLLAVLVLGVLLALVALVVRENRKARRAGYASFWAYLAATPKTDAEKRAAADLALKGVVICFLGLFSFTDGRCERLRYPAGRFSCPPRAGRARRS